ncbi:hypothetical protein A2U01_0051071, partial [Trifolium medium]|nr:hypothetical protein [Trifolium medium]
MAHLLLASALRAACSCAARNVVVLFPVFLLSAVRRAGLACAARSIVAVALF